MKVASGILVVCAGAMLAGCQSGALIGSVAGGECKVMERPQYEVRGVATYDQNWINREIEGGVGACKWPRPAARPPELDRLAARHPVAAPAKRAGLLKRIKARIKPGFWPAAPVAPVVVVPAVEAPAPSASPEPAPLVVPPCSRVDRLLHRCAVGK